MPPRPRRDQGNPGYAHRTSVAARALLIGLVATGPATPDAADAGAMSDRRWHDFFNALSEVGAYPADLDWHRAYRLDLLAPGRVPAQVPAQAPDQAR